METIAQKEPESQDQLVKREEKDVERYAERIDPEEFWEELGKRIKEGARITLEKTISYEFRQFIGALEYERSPQKAVACLEKDLVETLRFFDFPYRMWVCLRTTNIIERVFREFRRRTKVMDTFPTEESCIRIIFSLVQMINDDWKTKPMKNFR